MATIITNFSSKSSLIAAIQKIDTSEFTSSISSFSNIDSNWSVISSSSAKIVLENLNGDLFSLNGSFISFPASVTSMNLETSSGESFKLNGALSISSAGVISGYSSSLSLTTDSSSISLSGKLYLFTDGVTSTIKSMKVTSTQWSLELGGDFQSSDFSAESMSKAIITSLSMTFNGNKLSISNISLNALTEFNSTAETFDESFLQRMLAGADSITGGIGNDWLMGYGGKDALDGGTGTDTADYSDKTTAVKVTLNKSTNATVYVNGVAEDTIKNVENITGGSGTDTITGDAYANTLNGNSGNDNLNGGAGSDTLIGGAGTDKLYGGSDTVRDVFDFNSITESMVGTARDKVYNFLKGIDDLDLKTIDANTKVSGDQAFKFAGTKAGANSLWYAAKDVDGSTATKDIIVYGDVNGDAKADFEIGLVGVTSLTSADFVL